MLIRADFPMQFIGSFTTFHPIGGYFVVPYSNLLQSTVNTGTNNNNWPLIFDWMAGRAQTIIQGRTRTEIDNALATINYVLYLATEKIAGINDPTDRIPQIVGNLLNSDSISSEVFTPARLLKSQIPEFDIGNDEQFPNAKWSEYFAILTLAILGDIHRFYRLDGKISGATIGLAAEAMEALAIAEWPAILQPEINRPIQEQIRIRNQKSAIQGHAVRNEWKAKFWDWLEAEYISTLQGKPLNRRAAARKFYAAHVAPVLKKTKVPELENEEKVVRVLADSLARNPRFPNL
jgi:hypothetical protein